MNSPGGAYMSQEKAQRIHSVFSIFLSLVLIAAGLCLMVACILIYLSGDEPYSRESVAAAFSPISFVIYLCFILVILGFLLDLVLPLNTKRQKPEKQRKIILARLTSRADMTQCSAELAQKIHAQRRFRVISQIISAFLWSIGAFLFLIYALNDSRFTLDDINGSVIRAFQMLMICICIPFGYSIFHTYRSNISLEREIALLKQIPALAASNSTTAVKPFPLLIPRCILLFTSIILLVYGLLNGGTADVLVKAINICTECVGLG